MFKNSDAQILGSAATLIPKPELRSRPSAHQPPLNVVGGKALAALSLQVGKVASPAYILWGVSRMTGILCRSRASDSATGRTPWPTTFYDLEARRGDIQYDIALDSGASEAFYTAWHAMESSSGKGSRSQVLSLKVPKPLEKPLTEAPKPTCLGF